MGFGAQQDDFGPMSEINITPFVDVMLVLLIIFMVTAPLLESGIPIELPKVSTKALPKGEQPVSLSITQDQKMYLNDMLVEPSGLIAEVRQLFKGRKNKELFIRADGTLPYSFVAQTMAAVKTAGIDRIGLVTSAPDAKTGDAKKGR